MNILILIGRILISILFLWSAFAKIKNWNQCMEKMRMKGVPQISIVFPIGFILEILGGLSVLLGYMPRLGAILLLIYAIPHVFWMHRFWEIKEVESRKMEKAFFMKSLAVIGGLLLILAVGAGIYGFN